MSRAGQEGGENAVALERLFVAVSLPEEVLPHVRRAQDRLPDLRGVRRLGAGQLHVTVVFVGEVGPSEREAVEEVTEGLGSEVGGEITLGEDLLFLPRRSRPRVAALSLRDEMGILRNLHEKTVTGLERKGLDVREERKYRPHLTIARLKNTGPIKQKFEGEPVRFAVKSVCLFRSGLKPGGAVHTELLRVGLAAAGSD